MTVSTAARLAGPYTGAGTTDTFAFAFKVFSDEDIRVVQLVVSTDVETDLVLDSDYTVSLNADQDASPGGSITLVAGNLAAGYKVTIIGNLAYEQTADLISQGSWSPTVVENALDYLSMLVKQLKEVFDRTLTMNVNQTAYDANDVKISNLADGEEDQDAVTYAQLQAAVLNGASVTTPVVVGNGGTGATTAADARTNLGLGTMATQAASAVAITGGTIAGATIGTSLINEQKGADNAAAATLNLTTATGNVVDVTGNTGITAITLSEGFERVVRFTGTPTITHGASLVLPTAANITAEAGDYAIFRGYAAGVVRCVGYFRADGLPLSQVYDVAIAASDMTTALTTGTTKGYFRATRAFTITGIKASLTTVSSSGTPTFDINVNGSTILSTKLTIDANEKTSVTAATAAVLSSTAIAADDEITVDIDVAGTGAMGAIVYLLGTTKP